MNWQGWALALALVLVLGIGGCIERAEGAQGYVSACAEDDWCWSPFLDGNHQGRYLIRP